MSLESFQDASKDIRKNPQIFFANASHRVKDWGSKPPASVTPKLLVCGIVGGAFQYFCHFNPQTGHDPI